VVVSEWDASVPAVVQAWYSGMEGGHGLADVLVGRVDAAGRLPFSVPADESDLPVFEAEATSFTYDAWHGYWHLDRQGTRAAYPFGFGLSFTEFELEQAEASAPGGEIVVKARVRNTGGRPGTDVVQVYARRSGSDRPARLVGFARVEVDAGRSAEVVVRIRPAGLAERDVASHAMVVRPGGYEVRVARHAADAGIGLEVTLDEPVADGR
jgi:beta-glucosidase